MSHNIYFAQIFIYFGQYLRYHDWMQSPELLEQTASERLTISQEYDMQRSWYEDENSELRKT
jgi:hypothetical protein